MLKAFLIALVLITSCWAKPLEMCKWYRVGESSLFTPSTYVMKVRHGWVLSVVVTYGVSTSFIEDPMHTMESDWDIKE